MKKRKKMFTLLLLAGMLTLAAGCGRKDKNNADDMADNSSNQTTESRVDENDVPMGTEAFDGSGMDGADADASLTENAGAEADGITEGNEAGGLNNTDASGAAESTGNAVGNAVDDMGNAMGDMIDDAGNAAGNLIDDAGNAIGDTARDIENGIADLTDGDKTTSNTAGTTDNTGR